MQYDCEPEITIILKNEKKIFFIAYKEWIDLTLHTNEEIKLSKIEELFNYINMNDVIEIQDDIDHQFPIETQSIIVDNKLWIDDELPKDVFKKFRKHFSIYQGTMILYIIALLIYVIATVLHADNFDLPVIIACSLFGISIIVCMLGIALLDAKRKKIIQKYYGVVSEEDKLIAKQLLEEIDILDNAYDFFDLFRFDEEYSVIEQCLKLIIKGQKVYKSFSNIIFVIHNEITMNHFDNKYNDLKYNKYIEDFCNLMKRNNVDI